MTDLVAARDSLEAALAGAGIPVHRQNAANPVGGCMVFGEGVTDLEHLARGAAHARFRAVFFGGRWDSEAAADGVDGLLYLGMQAVRDAAGWRLDEVRRHRWVQLAGSDFLVAELIASRPIDL